MRMYVSSALRDSVPMYISVVSIFDARINWKARYFRSALDGSHWRQLLGLATFFKTDAHDVVPAPVKPDG